jgi:hypothetical protein
MLSGRHEVDGIEVLRVAKCASQSGLRLHDPGGAEMHSCIASHTILDESAHSQSYESCNGLTATCLAGGCCGTYGTRTDGNRQVVPPVEILAEQSTNWKLAVSRAYIE